MQRVLSSDLWKTVRATAQNAPYRKAAIAYVTQDLVGFREGDDLVVDASSRAVGCGETDAKLLRALHKKGVRLYDCEYLHAKVLLLGDVAVIGSANLSHSSAKSLVEAAVMTDQVSIVSAAASFIEQITRHATELTDTRIAALCKIPVVRRGVPRVGKVAKRRPKVSRLGNRTWLIGVREVSDPPAAEQKLIDQAEETLRSTRRDPAEEFDWVRWRGRSRFRQECREGDSVIQIWRSNKAKRPSAVYRSVPVLLVQRRPKWSRFFLPSPSGHYQEITWGKFQGLLRKLGYPRRIGPGIAHELDPEIADAIARNWNTAAKG